jgi:hypothetical protein
VAAVLNIADLIGGDDPADYRRLPDDFNSAMANRHASAFRATERHLISNDRTQSVVPRHHLELFALFLFQ